jgi:dienelactone hydrolase
MSGASPLRCVRSLHRLRRMIHSSAAAFICAALFGFSGAAAAQEKLHADVHETIVHVPVVVKDRYNKIYRAEIPVTIFRPDGDGPFPLLILNHGRGASAEIRAKLVRSVYESAGRYFVRKGFVVAMPTRLGNGDQPELGDPEAFTSCSNPAYSEITEAGVEQAQAVIGYMQKQLYIDPKKLVIAGQSVGGLMSVALTAKRPPGLIAAIDFSGGHGGNPDTHPGEPCLPNQLKNLFAQYAAEQAGKPPVPTLWIYTENDQFFKPKYTQAWHAAYVENGGVAEFHLLPSFKNNGHFVFVNGNDIWQPIVESFLNKVGFDKPGIIATPPATNFARLDDDEALPYQNKLSKMSYDQFLEKPKPRAFAISKNGHLGFASGDDAKSKALAFCRQFADTQCRLYAVDDQVVW